MGALPLWEDVAALSPHTQQSSAKCKEVKNLGFGENCVHPLASDPFYFFNMVLEFQTYKEGIPSEYPYVHH